MKLTTSITLLLGLLAPFNSLGAECYGRLTESINKSRSAISTNHFKINRDLGAYKFMLGPEFTQSLSKATKWIDMGAGFAQALIQSAKVNSSIEHIGVVATKPSLDQNLEEKVDNKALVKELDTAIENDLIKYHHGKYIEDIQDLDVIAKKGSVEVITDYYGVFSYSPNLEKVLEIFHELLKLEGKAFIVSHSTKVEQNGEFLRILDFINMEVKGFSAKEINSKTPGFILTKTSEDLSIPKLNLSEFLDKKPPLRIYKTINQ